MSVRNLLVWAGQAEAFSGALETQILHMDDTPTAQQLYEVGMFAMRLKLAAQAIEKHCEELEKQ